MAQSNAVKLGIKATDTVSIRGVSCVEAGRVMGVPESRLAAEAPDAAVTVLFATGVGDVTRQAQVAVTSTSPGGRTWIAYRKGAGRRPSGGAVPLHRDTLQAALAELGLGGVTLISLDDEWSAMRIKRVEPPASRT